MSRTKKDTQKYREEICEKVNAFPCGGPPATFKKQQKKIRRAKEKQALREKKEIPVFKKTDCWDWF